MASNREMKRLTAGSALKEDIVNQIEGGKLSPGDMILSATEFAKQYNISYVTAHKVFQELVEEGYCRRVTGKGTFVSDDPPTGKVSFVAIPPYHQENPFHAHMIEELTLAGARQGIHTIVGRAVGTLDLVERMKRYGMSAMIRFPGTSPGGRRMSEPEVWRLLQEQNIETVIINDFWREGGPFPHVRTDEAAGVSEMMDHLIGLGHRRILLVMESVGGMRPDAITAHQRAFERHDLSYDASSVFPLYESFHESRENTVREIASRATAAIAMYDLYAVDLATEFMRLGYVLGRDFSLAGFDGITEAEAHGLSTVVQPIREIASAAFDLLQRKDKQDVPKIMLKPTCVFRESTGPAPRE